MPIYEFKCKSCDNEFDKLTIFDWRTVGVTCESCESSELERIVSRTGGFASAGKIEFAPESSCQSCGSDESGSCRF